MGEKIYVGVDLGGTTIKVGLCDAKGQLLKTYEGDTEAQHGAEHVLSNSAAYVRKLFDQTEYDWDQVEGIGAGIPGFMDIPNGFVKLSPNLGWRNVDVKGTLEAKLGKSVRIDNDANVAALGEAWGGAGAGIDNLICFTLGTGVGGGIIAKGSLIQGFAGMAGELGHLNVVPEDEAISCGCGKKGCLETVSSATGIIYMAKQAVADGAETSLSSLESITAKDVMDAAKLGDQTAIKIVHRAAFYLGRAMALMSVTINPQRFVVGGGVSKAGEYLFQIIDHYYRELAVENSQEGVDIVPAVLSNDAGVVGAAGLHLFG
ncbi:ROK family glucokinase [Cohnella sp. WQ 127256]|uniref:ROK family glucokinase n=1 Tax=Cohnella sp. WQ 127256 TaxID=2938790 RepID=UPI002117E561|nr:ROK family glucokinase [Cohnella sp. WQ 127256]